MPDGWLLAILVLVGALLLQVVLVILQHRVRDALRRRRGRPSLAEERARRDEAHGDDELTPVGFGLPGTILRRGRGGRTDRGSGSSG